MRRFTSLGIVGLASSAIGFRGKAQQPNRSKKHAKTKPHSKKQEEAPWGFEDVDPATGKTAMEQRDEQAHQKVLNVLRSPLPELPPDGNYRPDILIGFTSYSHRIREQYRYAVAMELGVPLRCIKLSVGWSDKLDLRYMRKARHIAGITVLQEPVSDDVRPTERMPDSPHKREMLEGLIARINKEESTALTELTVVRADMARPEVEHRVDDSELSNGIEDLRRIIGTYTVVVLYRDGDDESASSVDTWRPQVTKREIVPLEIVVPSDASATVSAQVPKKHLVEADGSEGEAAGEGTSETLTIAVGTLERALLAHSGSALASERTSSGAPVAEDDPEASRVDYPCVFVRGIYIGSTRQMEYLTKNTQALDAMLLRPHAMGTTEKYTSI